MAMNKQRRTANLNNIVTYDTLKNVTLLADLTIEGLTGAGFVKADANGLLSVDTGAYLPIPSQTGNGGKYLTTDGANLSWGTVSTANIYNSDGTLTGNRNVTMGSNTLSFEKDIYTNNIRLGRGKNDLIGNVTIGDNGLLNISTGTYNTTIGRNAAYNLTSGNYNIAIGNVALFTNSISDGNTAIGMQSLRYTTGQYNTALGTYSGANITTGQYNTIVGTTTSLGLTTGSYNTVIGSQISGLSTTLSNNVILADGQGNIRIRAWDTGNVGIGGTTDAGYKLDVQGSGRFTDTITGKTGDGTGLNLFGSTLTFTNSGGTRWINFSNGGLNYGGGIGYPFNIVGFNNVTAIAFSSNGYQLTFAPNGLQAIFNTVDTYTFKKLTNSGNIPLYFDIVGSDAFSAINYGTRSGSVRIYAGTESFGNGEGYVVLAHNGSTVRGSVIVGGVSTAASSIFQVDSTTKGFLQPRMTTTERNAISSPATGLSIYNTTTNTNDYYNGTSWVSITTTASDTNIYNSDGTLTGNRTISTTSGYTLTINPATSFNSTVTLNSGSGEKSFQSVNALGYVTAIGTVSTGLTSGSTTAAGVRLSNPGYGTFYTYGTLYPGMYFGLSGVGEKVVINSYDGLGLYGYGSLRAIVKVYDSIELIMSTVAGAGITWGTNSSGLINASGKIFQTGNMTIGGTTDAGYKLDVQGTGRFTNNLLVNKLNIQANGKMWYDNIWGERWAINMAGDQDLNFTSTKGSQTISFRGEAGYTHILASTNVTSSIYIGKFEGREGYIVATQNGNTGSYTAGTARIAAGYTPGTVSAGATNISGTPLYINAANGGGSGLRCDIILQTVDDATYGPLDIHQLVDRLVIKGGTGNVGIGTTSPNYPLQVRRAGGAGSLGISIDAVGSTDRAVQYFAIQDSAAGVGAGHAFYYRGPSSTTDTLGYILDEVGYVGIGTASPDARLRVVGSYNGLQSIFGFTDGRGLAISTSIVAGTNEAGSVLNARGAGAGTMIFQTDGTERMRVTYGGNLLVGTTTDSGERLFVSGNAKLSNSAPYLSLTGTQVGGKEYRIYSAYTSADDLEIRNITDGNGIVRFLSTGAATFSSTIASGGDITAPYDTTDKLIGIRFSSTYYNGFVLNGTTRSTGIVSRSGDASDYIWFGTNAATERMRITSGGNLLVGTTSDSGAKLQVNGNATLYVPSVNTAALFISANNTNNWQFGINNGADFVITVGGGTNAIGTERMRITSGGNVGIGNTSPTQKLAVSGNAQVTHSYAHTTGAFTSGFTSYVIATTALSPSYTSGMFYGATNTFYQNEFEGSATVPNSVIMSSQLNVSRIRFVNASSTITMNQGTTGIRAIANQILQFQIENAQTSCVISHVAGSQILAPYYIGANTPTITNYYGLVINPSTEYSATLSVTNRWGVYQSGTSDNNWFAGKVIIGSTNTVGASPLNVKNLPTSSAGLSTGDIWSDAGTLKVV